MKILSTHEKKGIMPIGTIIPSILSETTFQNELGEEWVLCDGRDVTGSEYETLTGDSNIPDARGQVLRGKNNGRNDGNQDLDGERNLGSFQGQSTAMPNSNFTTNSKGSHSHTMSVDYNVESSVNSDRSNRTSNGTGTYEGSGTWTTSSSGNHSHNINGGGDDETRPKNICVNYFIKINNTNAVLKSWS